MIRRFCLRAACVARGRARRRPAPRSASSASSATSRCSATAICIVTETIAVRAEGRQIKRGILRDFPTIYRRADGSRVEVGFEVQSVMRDGSYEEFTTERMANGVRVRIGSAGRTVNTGVAHVRHPLPHHAADRLLRRLTTSSTGTPPAPAGPSRSTWPRRASICRRTSRSCRARSTPGRRARTARTPPWSSSSPAASCSAPRGRCRSPTG